MKNNNSDNCQDPTVFDKLLEPACPFVEEQDQKLTRHHNEKFFFPDFFRLLIFYFVSGISSVKLLINTHLEKDLLSPDLRMFKVRYSTFSDAFERFSPDLFKAVFASLICSVSLQSVPELATLGVLYCADGSLFPTLRSVRWAAYKQNCNAVRLHLCFELNRMIATDIMVGSGNSSERDALRQMLVIGVTYIADRGYASFRMFHDIVQAHAHFIIRVKSDLLYTAVESFSVQLPDSLKLLFSHVTDQAIQHDNDPCSYVWRLVRFQVCGDFFYILTDRSDLTTFQVIMLYAYRWQVELFFRFFKRTISGIHLIKHDKNGVTVQFYAMLITALLQLKLKQDTLIQKEQEPLRSELGDPDCKAKETDTPNSDDVTGSSDTLPDMPGTEAGLSDSSSQRKDEYNVQSDDCQAEETDTPNSEDVTGSSDILPDMPGTEAGLSDSSSQRKDECNVQSDDCQAEETDTPNSEDVTGSSDTLPDMPGTEASLSDSSSQHKDEYNVQSDEVVSHPYQFFEMIGEKLNKYWKIGIHWLTTLRQILHCPFDDRAIEILGGG
jgi:hypothetical protein